MLSCQNISFAYERNIVIHELSFSVSKGDYLCIVGENGTGKSTLVKGLLNLKRPLKGKVTVSGELGAGDIGYMPQQSALQKDFPASVYEVVLSGRLGKRGARPFYSKTDRAAAIESLKLLSITDIKKKCFRELSGGQQQRVLLARALCSNGKLLLLDEPAAGLDPIAAQEMYRQIERLNRLEITVIMVSHDIKAALSYSSHILHLQNERYFFGTKEAYLESEIGSQYIKND